jgi:CBS-domain-containing membrane protein
MHIEKLMTRQVKWCKSEDTLEHAAQLMWDGDCGALPVCGPDGASHVVGIITDRDICMSALFQGKPLRELNVSSAMSSQVLTCTANQNVSDVEKAMRQVRVRRVPVVDGHGSLVGIVGLADLARAAAHDRTEPNKEITESEVGDTLAAICEPRVTQVPRWLAT